MPDTWDREVDLLVAGTGAAALSAAVTAADAGLTTLVVESTERWGGTTMRSGGGLWTIGGLYAAGNTTASVMGRTYPGPGSTIAPAVVLGYLGARHAVASLERETTKETRA